MYVNVHIYNLYPIHPPALISVLPQPSHVVTRSHVVYQAYNEQIDIRSIMSSPEASRPVLQLDQEILSDVPAEILPSAEEKEGRTTTEHRWVRSKDLHQRMLESRPIDYLRNFDRRIVEANEILAKKVSALDTTSFSLECEYDEDGEREGEGEKKVDAATLDTLNPPSPTLRFEVTHLCVADIDTVTAAMVLGTSDCCVLNFANAETPGGRYLTNGRAQEEDLCRLCPQLHPSLAMSGKK